MRGKGEARGQEDESGGGGTTVAVSIHPSIGILACFKSDLATARPRRPDLDDEIVSNSFETGCTLVVSRPRRDRHRTHKYKSHACPPNSHQTLVCGSFFCNCNPANTTATPQLTTTGGVYRSAAYTHSNPRHIGSPRVHTWHKASPTTPSPYLP